MSFKISSNSNHSKRPPFPGRTDVSQVVVCDLAVVLEFLDLPLERDHPGSHSRDDECRIFLPIFTLVV